jgi:hypothetical protein
MVRDQREERARARDVGGARKNSLIGADHPPVRQKLDPGGPVRARYDSPHPVGSGGRFPGQGFGMGDGIMVFLSPTAVSPSAPHAKR